MSDVVRLKSSTVEDLDEVRKVLEKELPYSFPKDISNSSLLDMIVSVYLKDLKAKIK